MTNASQREMSHADRHDLDKLSRWKAGLDADNGASVFPVCAIFLVSPEDRASHDVFRRYRSAFEELGGGFHHLVIFGQHGISSTQVAFLDEVRRGQDSVPLLAIVPMSAGADSAHCVELPKGDRNRELDETQTWGAALERICASCGAEEPLVLEGVDGVATSRFRRGTLAEAVAGVFVELSGQT